MFKYSIDSYDGVTFIVDLLWPYLGIVKREQAKDAIAKYEGWRP